MVKGGVKHEAVSAAFERFDGKNWLPAGSLAVAAMNAQMTDVSRHVTAIASKRTVYLEVWVPPVKSDDPFARKWGTWVTDKARTKKYTAEQILCMARNDPKRYRAVTLHPETGATIVLDASSHVPKVLREERARMVALGLAPAPAPEKKPEPKPEPVRVNRYGIVNETAKDIVARRVPSAKKGDGSFATRDEHLSSLALAMRQALAR
jgi:hypothetical protein